MLLSASLTFGGEYCKTAKQRKNLKASFKTWDVLMVESCYESGSCFIKSLTCDNDDVNDLFVVTVSFKETVNEVIICSLFFVSYR